MLFPFLEFGLLSSIVAISLITCFFFLNSYNNFSNPIKTALILSSERLLKLSFSKFSTKSLENAFKSVPLYLSNSDQNFIIISPDDNFSNNPSPIKNNEKKKETPKNKKFYRFI